MNTQLRNIVRVVSYLLAVAALLGGIFTGGDVDVIVGAALALILVVFGKVVWAGRAKPANAEVSNGERLAARMYALQAQPSPVPRAPSAQPPPAVRVVQTKAHGSKPPRGDKSGR